MVCIHSIVPNKSPGVENYCPTGTAAYAKARRRMDWLFQPQVTYLERCLGYESWPMVHRMFMIHSL